ncbi:MAG: nuclease-related domain-containing protein [Bacteroidales bacterium]|nr:nuclease-related domain-containing protein [Bacteroidales bacterium]
MNIPVADLVIYSLILTTIVVSINKIVQFYKDRKLLKTVTTLDRGTWSERKLIIKLLKSGLPSSTIFHDLYIEKHKGSYSQIDIVVPTKVGILVFEVKDYSGWIFGKGYQTYWTQVLAYGEEKHKLYNPIKQNQRHIEILRSKMKQFADVPFYSIIVFYGDCELRDVSFIPEDTIIIYPNEITYTINNLLENKPKANYSNKREVVNFLQNGVNNGNDYSITSRHIQNVSQIIENEKIN